MIQIRIHGRGGQGVVAAAELIATAAFKDGLYAQAFPFFGVERSGAPIQAYARIDRQPIITREQVYAPDFLVIEDAGLLQAADTLAGVTKKTIVIVNSPEKSETIKKIFKINIKAKQIICIPATDIALHYLGINLVNTSLLGALVKVSKIISLESLISAITEKFAGKSAAVINNNIDAAKAAFKYEGSK